MQGENILLEWNMHKSCINIKRDFHALLFLSLLALISLGSFINFWIVVILLLVVLYLVAKYYINIQKRCRYNIDINEIVERYRITNNGFTINNLIFNTTKTVAWSEMECFYVKPKNLITYMTAQMFGDIIFIENKKKHKFRLRCNSDIMFNFVKILSERLPFKNIMKNTKEMLDLSGKSKKR